MAREALTEEQLAAKAEPKNAKAAQAQSPAKPQELEKPKSVTVFAKHGFFVDLVKDVNITSTPIEVEHHGWLQAQIDAGHLIEA